LHPIRAGALSYFPQRPKAQQTFASKYRIGLQAAFAAWYRTALLVTSWLLFSTLPVSMLDQDASLLANPMGDDAATCGRRYTATMGAPRSK